MIRVVIDTNVIVSANLVGEGAPAAILDLAAKPKDFDAMGLKS